MSKQPNITALKNQKCRLEEEGYLLDCWIGKYRPGGTAKGNNVYYQLRSRKPLGNGKKSKHLKTEELPHFRRLIANGRQLRRIERQLKKLHYKLASREVLTSSETNEWYTPPGYVDLARSVMDGVDLDPASNAVAQQWIQAVCHYTVADNGLLKPWFGCVWLNPPYGGQVSLWIEKAIDEYDQGNIQQGIILVKPAVGSSWYQQLSSRYPRCEPHKRIKFIDVDGKQQSSPVHGNVFFYLGEELGRFKDVFSAIGTVSAPL